jgi:hypothetical protein
MKHSRNTRAARWSHWRHGVARCLRAGCRDQQIRNRFNVHGPARDRAKAPDDRSIRRPTGCSAGVYGDNFDYFFDATSQLYYQRKTPAGTEARSGFFGGGELRTAPLIASSNLPADRPAAGPPLGGVIQVN